ncbi:MAG: hypothetical protein KDC98_07605 [Planctomycetes bacterium]|nr:hypothetical protein [Planctomycetota bacterium]
MFVFQRAGRRGGCFVARKVSDLVLLLGSRGNGRGRRGKSGLLGNLGGTVLRLLGGSSTRRGGGSATRRGVMLPGWLAFALALACFGGGFLVGDRFGFDGDDSGAGLNVNHSGGGPNNSGPRAPRILEADTEVLASHAYFVAAYEDMPEDEARTRAIRLSEYLAGHGLAKARPYVRDGAHGRVWFVTVYYSGNIEKAETRTRLQALPEDVPCPVFVGLRNQGNEWPQAFPVQ